MRQKDGPNGREYHRGITSGPGAAGAAGYRLPTSDDVSSAERARLLLRAPATPWDDTESGSTPATSGAVPGSSPAAGGPSFEGAKPDIGTACPTPGMGSRMKLEPRAESWLPLPALRARAVHTARQMLRRGADAGLEAELAERVAALHERAGWQSLDDWREHVMREARNREAEASARAVDERLRARIGAPAPKFRKLGDDIRAEGVPYVATSARERAVEVDEYPRDSDRGPMCVVAWVAIAVGALVIGAGLWRAFV